MSILRVISLSGYQGTSDGRPYSLSEVYYRYHNFWGVDKGKDEETLRSEYRAIAERRIRLGLLLSEIGRTNNIAVSGEELARAMRQEASRYPGQEQQVLEFFRKNPQAAENLRSPIFEEKVVDFMLELAKVTERAVPPDELATAAAA